jgi:DNA (cytosine-5)-methyltransferase 1
MSSVPVIDLFAGPGGLGEGFSFLYEGDMPYFKIVLSIEKDSNAHSTLELRSFFRQFYPKEVPEDYYRFLRQEISRSELFDKYPEQAEKARSEAKLATLGGTDVTLVDQWIQEALHGDRKKWVLIGGPSCQAYSLAGRSRNKGKRGYEPAEDERHYLYREYLRIISKHWPSVFGMENVKGLLSAQVDGQRLFDKIYEDLENPGKATESEEKHRVTAQELNTFCI